MAWGRHLAQRSCDQILHSGLQGADYLFLGQRIVAAKVAV